MDKTRKKNSLELENASSEEWDFLVDEGFLPKITQKIILSE